MDIYSEIIAALETEEQVILATIISTSGSTPASALSKMLIKNNCTTSIGTIGGGCVEADVLARAKNRYEAGTAETSCFELREDEFIQGLICGGTLNVLIEPITREQIPILEKVKSIRDRGNDCIIATHLSTMGAVLKKAVVFEDQGNTIDQSQSELEYWNSLLHQSEIKSSELFIDDLASKALHHNSTTHIKLTESELILEPVSGLPHLILFGGGHVSKAISKMAALCGFRITVIDDREPFCNPTRFPEAAETIVMDFSEVFQHLPLQSTTYIVIVTRGHRYDEEVLEKALKTPAKYIGMIGSKRKIATTYSRLQKYGISLKDLKRVHAPIGLSLGAVTPEEIAVSVIAQLIRERRGMKLPALDLSDSMTDYFDMQP